MTAKTLSAWSGSFGDAYTQRNAVSAEQLRARILAWSRIIDVLKGDLPKSVLEVGSNLGLNLRALPFLLDAQLHALEPNASAREVLLSDNVLEAKHIYQGFGHEIALADNAVDMVFTCGVLIHVAPEHLEATLKEIHRVSAKYIVCIEYFARKPETIHYQGEADLLFKNDFGGLYLDQFDDLVLLDYGFFWKRVSGMDDCTYWIFKKR